MDIKYLKPHKPYPKSKLWPANKPYDYGEVWGTLDGQVIAIENLRDGHLNNIVEHIKRRGNQDFLPYIIEEIDRRKKAKLIKKGKAGKILYGN